VLVFRWERKNNKSVGFENFFQGFKERLLSKMKEKKALNLSTREKEKRFSNISPKQAEGF